MAEMSTFWASGGAITREAWAEKECRQQAEEETQRQADQEAAKRQHIEAIPLSTWMSMNAARRDALFDRYYGFTPSPRVNLVKPRSER